MAQYNTTQVSQPYCPYSRILFNFTCYCHGHFRKRDEELGIRQQELQLEHRHAQLKEELNMRLSCNSKYQ